VPKANFGCSLDEDLLRRIDEARGDIPRSAFIERILDWALVSPKKTEVERDG